MLELSAVESIAADGVFVGIDWGNAHHQMCVLDTADKSSPKPEPRMTSPVLARSTGSGAVTARSPGSRSNVPRGYSERLQHQGHRLFCVSPKMSARGRERYRLAPTKSDAFDAFVLADMLRHDHRHWRSLSMPSPLLAELRALTGTGNA
jgi:hypothetical protein